MKKKNNSLEVRPVRRYKVPRYPSHLEPNPVDHPETLPYPFQQKVLNFLLAAGVSGSLAFMLRTDASEKPALASETELVSDTLKNTFPSTLTGLPFETSPYGTGLPSWLKADDARAVIEQVFQSEGVALTKNVPISKDGLKLTAHGYNPELKIGYVWLDGLNLGSDSYIAWQDVINGDLCLPKYGLLDLKIALRLMEMEPIEEFYLDKKYLDIAGASVLNGEPMEESEAFQCALGSFFASISLRNGKNQPGVFIDYVNGILSMEEGKEKYDAVLKYRKVAFISKMSQFNTNLSNTFISLSIEIANLKDHLASNRQLDILSKFAESAQIYNSQNADTGIFLEIVKALQLPADERMEIWQPLYEKLDMMSVSLREIEMLDHYAERLHLDFIMPVSQFDPRTMYFYYDLSDEEFRQKLKAAKTLEERINVNRQQNELLVQQKLKILEDQVREYIRWAKSQQGY